MLGRWFVVCGWAVGTEIKSFRGDVFSLFIEQDKIDTAMYLVSGTGVEHMLKNVERQQSIDIVEIPEGVSPNLRASPGIKIVFFFVDTNLAEGVLEICCGSIICY